MGSSVAGDMLNVSRASQPMIVSPTRVGHVGPLPVSPTHVSPTHANLQFHRFNPGLVGLPTRPSSHAANLSRATSFDVQPASPTNLAFPVLGLSVGSRTQSRTGSVAGSATGSVRVGAPRKVVAASSFSASKRLHQYAQAPVGSSKQSAN